MLNLETIDRILKNLSKSNPVFHSEADFQHSLAWALREELKQQNTLEAKIRLEKPMQLGGNPAHLDILISADIEIAIELKYRTSKAKDSIIVHDGERFDLKDQSAQDCGRYYFVRDLKRLEQFTANVESNSKRKIGYAIFLTNDKSYWETPKPRTTKDQEYRIHAGRVLTGRCAWNGDKPPETKNDAGLIELCGKYEMQWKPYSESDLYSFKYILNEVRQPL